MFVHWSNTETTYRDMEKVEILCNKCESNQLHTLRLYEKKTKHYSTFSIGADRSVTIICHGCLLESRLQKTEEEMLIKKYLKLLIVAEGFELYEKGKIDKAVKRFREVLKEDAEHSQALYGLAQSLIVQGKFDEANKYVNNLIVRFPENDDVKKLKENILRNAQ